MYLRCNETRYTHNSTNATQYGYGWHAVNVQCQGSDRVTYVFPHRSHTCHSHPPVAVHAKYATADVTCGGWTVSSTVQPVVNYISGAPRNIDIHIQGGDVAHGILGQNIANPRDGTLDKYPSSGEYTTHAQAEGAIEGHHLDYVVDSPYDPGFRFSMFAKQAARQSESRIGEVGAHAIAPELLSTS